MRQLDANAVDSGLYRLRRKPHDPGARAEFLDAIRPVLGIYEGQYALVPETLARIVPAAEALLVGQLPEVVTSWFSPQKGRESRLLRRVRRAVELAAVAMPPDPVARIIEDDLKLQHLSQARGRGHERVLVRILAETLGRARQHFDAPRGRRFLKLAEKCCYALVVHGKRPSWHLLPTQRWGRGRYEIVREVYSLCQQWAREVLANHIDEVTHETP